MGVGILKWRDIFKRTNNIILGAIIAMSIGVFAESQVSNAEEKEPIKVGVLHSLSGTMAISEVSLHDVVLMAIDEINAEGGLLGGRKVVPVVEDPARQGVFCFRLLDFCKSKSGSSRIRKVQPPPVVSCPI